MGKLDKVRDTTNKLMPFLDSIVIVSLKMNDIKHIDGSAELGIKEFIALREQMWVEFETLSKTLNLK